MCQMMLLNVCRTQVKAATINQRQCPSYNVHVQLLCRHKWDKVLLLSIEINLEEM